jgi:ABC-2 type transport system permease protein
MNTQSQAPESALASPTSAPVGMAATQPLAWSVRRELWENRSIYMPTLVVAALILFGYSISTIHLATRMLAALELDPVKQHAAIDRPYTIAAIALMVTAFIVAIFYCLDALHSERRDRSILFWKSLPVSDLTTVLAKASIPLLVLPLLTFAVITATQLIMLLLSSAVLQASGADVATLWTQVKFVHSSLAQLYALTAATLWYAPIYGWLLLVSGWARRATFLWAVLPVLALGVVEKIAFNTSHTGAMLKHRFAGWVEQAFVPGMHDAMDPLAPLDPVKFLGTPGLWLGLIIAAAFVAAAARLRRYRQPI